jgi:hypothetical protein
MSTALDHAVPADTAPVGCPVQSPEDLAANGSRVDPPTAGSRVPEDLASARDLHGRLNAALEALGLSDALTPRWSTPARSGFFFAPHNLHQATRLVTALEDLHEAVGRTGVDPPVRRGGGVDPDQLSLPFVPEG